MPKTSEMRESKFLKKEDVGAGALMTITGCEQYNVAMSGAEPEHKWCLTFAEADKPLVLNSINTQICERICESDDTDDWIGKKVVLYTDQAAEMRVVLEKVDLFDKIFKNLNMHLVAKESTDLLDKYRHYLEGE